MLERWEYILYIFFFIFVAWDRFYFSCLSYMAIFTHAKIFNTALFANIYRSFACLTTSISLQFILKYTTNSKCFSSYFGGLIWAYICIFVSYFTLSIHLSKIKHKKTAILPHKSNILRPIYLQNDDMCLNYGEYKCCLVEFSRYMI